MLATPGSLPGADQDDRWAYETKLDGQRCIVLVHADGSVELRSRSGEDITPAYPELHPLADGLAAVPAVFDGEIIAPDERGHSDFERLQPRMALTGHPARAARLRHEVPVHLTLFDALFASGRPLIKRPYSERRAVLEGLALRGPHWSTPSAIVGHGERALAATAAEGLEGLVCKRLDSVYRPGVRSPSWVKIRHVQTIDVVIGGWVPGRGRLSGLPGAVLVGVPENGELRYVGAVGTGWKDRDRAELGALLDVAAARECPFATEPAIADARWVLPRLVGEVHYANRTSAGLLRHPSWHRLRPDLAP